MYTVVLLNHVNRDGIGDFSHLLDIYNELRSHPQFRAFEFVPVICCQPEQISRIQSKLLAVHVSNHFVGTEAEYHDRFKQQLQEVFDMCQQIIQISYAASFISCSEYRINPDVLLKFIGEHENQSVRYLPLPFDTFNAAYIKNISMGLGEGHWGVKIKKLIPIDMGVERKELFADISMTESEMRFKRALLSNTQSIDMSSFNHSNSLYPAYFNHHDNLIRFLFFLGINQKMRAGGKNIAIYLSGGHVDVSKLQLTESYAGYADQTDIKQIELIGSAENTLPVILVIKPLGDRTIRIFYGFHLEDPLYDAVYQQASIVGVSGDNTFEKAISNKVLPFYCSTNAIMKKSTLIALAKIIQDEIHYLPEKVKQDFVIYFKEFFQFIHSWGRGEALRRFQKTIPLFMKLDLDEMSKHWPQIAFYLFENYNFYNQLEAVILDGVDRPELERMIHAAISTSRIFPESLMHGFIPSTVVESISDELIEDLGPVIDRVDIINNEPIANLVSPPLERTIVQEQVDNRPEVVHADDIPQPIPAPIIDPDLVDKRQNQKLFNGINMQILSGFIGVLGVAAIAVAFTALSLATFGTAGVIVGGIGLVAVLMGCGLFKVGHAQTRDERDLRLMGQPG